MIRISELLAVKLFSDFKLIAGEDGINNLLSNIVILEYESFTKAYEVFSSGDFVLTSLFFAKDNESLIEDALTTLINKDVSGIAVKTVFYNDIPDSIKALANARNIPIFTFANAYMEDLIIYANDLLESKAHFLLDEEKVARLLETKPSFNKSKDTLREINSSMHKYIFSALIMPKHDTGIRAISYYFKKQLYNKYKFKTKQCYSFVKYKNSMFLIYSSDTLFNNNDYKNIVLDCILQAELKKDDFYIGISNTSYTHEYLTYSLKEAINTAKLCKLQSKDLLCYSELGAYKFITLATNEPMLQILCQKEIAILKEYDSKYTSNLLLTLIDYVKCNGEISKTAAMLYQHPNTIRYRLKKACELLGYDESNMYSQFFILINVYLLL